MPDSHIARFVTGFFDFASWSGLLAVRVFVSGLFFYGLFTLAGKLIAGKRSK